MLLTSFLGSSDTQFSRMPFVLVKVMDPEHTTLGTEDFRDVADGGDLQARFHFVEIHWLMPGMKLPET
jgi:hypothetical protein